MNCTDDMMSWNSAFWGWKDFELGYEGGVGILIMGDREKIVHFVRNVISPIEKEKVSISLFHWE